MSKLLIIAANKIPARIRKTLLDEKFIDKAVNTTDINTPMEYIFDVYAEFIDVGKEYSDWNCSLCREHVLKEMRKLKPYLESLQKNKIV